MAYKSSDLAIVIPSKNYKNIKLCIKSIKKQTRKPGQTIIVFDKKKNFKSTKKILFSYTKHSNQVLQRTHGLNLINKRIKLILQLDDKFYLHKKALENLINEWNMAGENVAGIGIKSNLKNFNFEKFSLLKYLTLSGSNKPGKVLKSGFNNQPISKNKLKDVDWLQGGLSSWRLNCVPHIFNRKFPLNRWSVLEDLIFSYNVKFKKNFKLEVSSGIKAFVIQKTKHNYNINEYYYRGYEYARMHKVFVNMNSDRLSKVAFFYSYVTTSILGILWCSFKVNRKFFFYIGKLKGIFANTKKIKVL